MTNALNLLDGAASTLRDLAPSLAGDARYTVLLSANAVAMARRDLATAGRSEARRAALGADAAAIRAGAYDDDGALYDRLFAHAALCAWVSDPKALTKAEHAAHVESE